MKAADADGDAKLGVPVVLHGGEHLVAPLQHRLVVVARGGNYLFPLITLYTRHAAKGYAFSLAPPVFSFYALAFSAKSKFMKSRL